MKVMQFYFLFKVALLLLILCDFVTTALKEIKEDIGTNEINTKFVKALQISETDKGADFEDKDHKVKMSVVSVNSENPDSRVSNFVYLLKHDELKGFLKTLPIEILRKLRTLASKDIDSAQKFVIRLAQERKKKWGDSGISEKLGLISEARARPLISQNATTNFMDRAVINLSTSTRRPHSMSGFLRNYTFTPSPSINANRSHVNVESQSQWKPITAAPPTIPDNTVTYIVHEVIHPKHPLNHSFIMSSSSTTSSTTEKYPSILPPMTDPPPTPPFSTKAPNENYRQTILHDKNLNGIQLPVGHSQKMPDNHYSASRQHHGSKNPSLKDSWPQSQNSFNVNENPSTLLPHAQTGITTQYSWGIAPSEGDTNSYYMNHVMYLPGDDQIRDMGDITSNMQDMNNYYYDYSTLSTASPVPNGMQGYNYVNSFNAYNRDSNRNSLQTLTTHNSPQSHPQQVMYPMVNTNEANNYYVYPSGYYAIKPSSSYYQNNEIQDLSNGHRQSHSVYKDNKKPAPSSSHLYNNQGSGWTDTVSDHSHDYQYKGMWHRAKAYFYKGDRTVAEKIFEVSLGILAFMAFGGYLLMLIYQVFAATSSVPLFPLVTQAVPSNPGLLGILFGRKISPNVSFNRYLNTQLDSLENQVNIAFRNVISKFYPIEDTKIE